jgi:hypothetical protein
VNEVRDELVGKARLLGMIVTEYGDGGLLIKANPGWSFVWTNSPYLVCSQTTWEFALEQFERGLFRDDDA